MNLINWFAMAAALVTLPHDDKKVPEQDAGLFPNLKVWQRHDAPFAFVIDADLPSHRLAPVLEWAIKIWNNVVPGVFTPYGELERGGHVIPILPMSELRGKKPSRTTIGICRMMIKRDSRQLVSAALYLDERLFPMISDFYFRRTIVHELGHVLGLAHDPARNSIMHRQILNQRFSDITAKDAELLRGIYL